MISAWTITGNVIVELFIRISIEPQINDAIKYPYATIIFGYTCTTLPLESKRLYESEDTQRSRYDRCIPTYETHLAGV